MPERIVQFGEGVFLRGFADWMIDLANEQGLLNGGIVVVQPIRQGLIQTLNEQDGLYTLLLRGVQDGHVIDSRRIITSIRRAIDPHVNWDDLLECFRRPELRFIISNTTEAGIAYVPERYMPGRCPESFPAKAAALLHERFRSRGGDPASGLIFLPCELIERNGENLRAIVLRHADAWGLVPEFSAWIRTCSHFLNTLVDRIVPGYPRDEAATLAEELGYEDTLLDTGEIFHLWMIEGPAHLAEEFPLHRAGMNVVWTDDLSPYRTRKVRILNGAHTACSLAAVPAGLNTVREMIEDPLFGQLIHKAVFEEIVPTIPLDPAEKMQYARSVLERFRNPFIRHELLSISLNSVSKWTVRVLPSLRDSLAAEGRLPTALTFSLAALLRFYAIESFDGTQARGRRGDGEYPIRDDTAVLALFMEAWAAYRRDGATRSLVRGLLANPTLWAEDLTVLPGLADAVTGWLERILSEGMRTTVEAVVRTAGR